jgi:hypothetical protein
MTLATGLAWPMYSPVIERTPTEIELEDGEEQYANMKGMFPQD